MKNRIRRFFLRPVNTESEKDSFEETFWGSLLMGLGGGVLFFGVWYFIEWLIGYFKGGPIDTQFRLIVTPGGLACAYGLWELLKGIAYSMRPSMREEAPETLGAGLGAFFGGLIATFTFIKIFL